MAGPARVHHLPEGQSPLRAPTLRSTTETHVTGVTAVEAPGETIVSRLGPPRILQFA